MTSVEDASSLTRSHEGVHFGWFIPTAGDTTAFGDPGATIPPSVDMFVRVARAAEHAGFEYALVPVQTMCYEAWVSCAMISAQTERLTMLVAARPGYMQPTLAAKMISTFDQLSRGRISINLIAGGGYDELAADGVFHGHDERYAIMDETVTLMKRVWTEEQPVTYTGKHFRVENAIVRPRPYQQPYPPFYLGGISPAAKAVCGKHADVFLIWGDTHERVAEEVAAVRAVAAQCGREQEIRFGVRIQVLIRDSEARAWRDAEALIARAAESQKQRMTTMWEQSQAQARMRELAKVDGYRIGRHLWSGVTTVRPGAGVLIVGTPAQVAETLQGYVELGCSEFCLSGYPHDEEAERFGRLVMPYFKAALAHP